MSLYPSRCELFEVMGCAYFRICVTPMFCFPYILFLTADLCKKIIGSLQKVKWQKITDDYALEFSPRTCLISVCRQEGPVFLKPEKTLAFRLTVTAKPNQQ